MAFTFNPLAFSGFENSSSSGGGGSGTVTSVATGTGLTGGPITTTGTISLANTAVTPGSFTNANITVDAQGRLTAATNGSAGSGTVTSVALALPSIFSVSGSPVTTSGTLTGSFNTQTANAVFAGPSSGVPAIPTFRSLVVNDIPSLSGLYANLSLSNLSSTSVNAQINMNANSIAGTKATFYQNVSQYWNGGAGPAILSNSGIAEPILFGSADATGDAVDTYDTSIVSGAQESVTGTSVTGGVGLQTGDNYGSGISGTIACFTGSNFGTGDSGIALFGTGSSDNGNSGNTIISTGTAAITRGKIRLQDGSEGTSGYVWTSTDAFGSGSWAAPSSGSTFSDSAFRIQDNGDATKQLAFEVSSIATGTTRTITMPDSNLNLSTSTSGTFATNTLNNLGTTSINANLTPSTADTFELGASSKTWKSLYVDSNAGFGVRLFNSIVESAQVRANITTPSGVSGAAGIAGISTSPVDISTASSATANATATANIYIESGNKTAGTGNSGSIIVTPGTSAGGTVGTVQLNSVVQIGASSTTPVHKLNTSSTTGGLTATTTNSPVAGNPAGWMQITINNVTSYIPFWQ